MTDPARKPGSPGHAPGRKILLVEDDRDLSAILSEYLGSQFYEVTVVDNGAEGLRAVLASDFGVILCDMVMPTMAGDVFYEAVRRCKPALCDRFLFLTAHGRNPRVSDFLAQHSGRVLHKPFHLDDLLDAMLEVLKDEGARRGHLDEPPGAPALGVRSTETAR